MVTVIIPVYNRERYIGDAIESVLTQTHENLEVIVVDDGSTDGTRQVVESFCNDPRLIYRHQPNSGKPSVVRNQALRMARGRYICFLDSDDILVPDSIAQRVELLKSNVDIGAVCGHWLDFRGAFSVSKLTPSYIIRGRFLQKLPDSLVQRRLDNGVVYGHDFIYEMFYTNVIKTSSVMVRRELIDEVGHFDETMTIGEDCDLWMRLGNVTYFCYILSPVCYARSHDQNITFDKLRNHIEDTKVLDKFLKGHRFHSRIGKKRFYKRVAHFYFDGGWLLYNRYRIDEAKMRFRRALRYRPTMTNFQYAVLTQFPLGTIKWVRQTKRKIAGLLSPQEFSGS